MEARNGFSFFFFNSFSQYHSCMEIYLCGKFTQNNTSMNYYIFKLIAGVFPYQTDKFLNDLNN